MLHWEQIKVGDTIYLNKFVEVDINQTYFKNKNKISNIEIIGEYTKGEVIHLDNEVCEILLEDYFEDKELTENKILYYYKNENSPTELLTIDEYELWKQPQLILSGKYDLQTIQFIMLKLGYLKDCFYNTDNVKNYTFKP